MDGTRLEIQGSEPEAMQVIVQSFLDMSMWLAPGMGMCLVAFGLYRLVKSDVPRGTVAMLGGCFLIGVPAVIEFVKTRMN
jgi:hypothetical protein